MAIYAFFKYLWLEQPHALYQYQQILTGEKDSKEINQLFDP